MSKQTRRWFIAGASAIPFSLWLQGCKNGNGGGGNESYGEGSGNGGGEPSGGPMVRYDARSTEGQAMLQIYADAVDKMKTMIAEGDPTSWVFQWYIHGVKGSTTKAAEIARIYPTPSADRDLAMEVWNTCQAHYPGDDENFFLPWHRMYVYFFETIIRQVSGNASFTLPYWNYSAADPTIRGVIPPEFGQDTSPLFVGKRNPGVNDGQPIQQGSPDDPLSLVSLSECDYEPSGALQGFNMRLDFGLHGNIHVLTGNGQNMGSVPWAAGDPIFWAHHCNIDRLWASWNAGGRTNPTSAQWLDQTFVFADANGQRVVGRVGDFTAIAPLGYSYDRLEPVPPCPTTEALLARPMRVRAAATGVALADHPVRVQLTGVAENEAFTLSDTAASAGRRLYVVVKGLETEVQPGVLYNLYVGLPDEAAPAEPHLAGTFNFFGAMGHGGEEMAHEGASTLTEKFLSFDVTDLARQLGSEAAGREPTLTFAPAGQAAAEAQPVLGEVSLVEQ